MIMPEATLHCVMPWRAGGGRPRRALMLRHAYQHAWQDRQSDDLKAHGLSALTSELMAFGGVDEVKAVARMTAAEIQARFDEEEKGGGGNGGGEVNAAARL